jgi:nicotinamide mononucleotide transporter
MSNWFDSTVLLEWITFMAALAYVYFAAQKKIVTWVFALISVGLTFYLDVIGKLYIESGLQVFYFVMAIYGWINWKKAEKNDLPIARWSIQLHLLNIFASASLALLVGYLFANYTEQSTPYLDAFTTCFSLVATFMVVKRVIENWLYWIFINMGMVVLYLNNGYEILALQYGLFVILAIYGYWSWNKALKRQE